MTCGVILRHATQGAEGGVRARLSLYNNVLIYNQVTGSFFFLQWRKETHVKILKRKVSELILSVLGMTC